MSDARPAAFRTIGDTATAPSWMTATSSLVATHAFPRHPEPRRPEEAPIEVAREDVESGEHAVLSAPPAAPTRVPSIAPAPPLPSIPPAPPSTEILDAARALLTARSEIVADIEDELLAMALEVARAVIESELDARPELHRELVSAALRVLGPGVSPRVKVAPVAFDAMVAALGGRTFEAEGRRLELEIDPTLVGAGVVLEAGEARVDGTIEARLHQARAALARARRGVTSEAA